MLMLMLIDHLSVQHHSHRIYRMFPYFVIVVVVVVRTPLNETVMQMMFVSTSVRVVGRNSSLRARSNEDTGFPARDRPRLLSMVNANTI